MSFTPGQLSATPNRADKTRDPSSLSRVGRQVRGEPGDATAAFEGTPTRVAATLVGFVGGRGSADADCGVAVENQAALLGDRTPTDTSRLCNGCAEIQWKAVIWPISEASKLWC